MDEEQEPVGAAAPAANEPQTDEPQPDEPQLDEPKLDEPKLDEPTPDEPQLDEPKLDEPKLDEPTPDEPKPEEPRPIPLGAAAEAIAIDLEIPAAVARERLEHVAAAIARKSGASVADCLRQLCPLNREFLAVLCARSDEEAARAAVDVCGLKFPREA